MTPYLKALTRSYETKERQKTCRWLIAAAVLLYGLSKISGLIADGRIEFLRFDTLEIQTYPAQETNNRPKVLR